MAINFIQRNYARTAFTSVPVNTPINLSVLRTAIGGLSLSVPATDVISDSGGGAIVLWDDFPLSADITAVDAAIAAHTGTATSSLLQQFSSLAETTNATTSFADKAGADFVSSPLNAGRWQLSIAAQLRTTAVVVNSGVRAIMRAGVGGSLGPSDDRDYTDHSVFSATQPQLWVYVDTFAINAGQQLRFMPRFARSGAAATAAMLNFRADLTRIGD